MVNNQENFNPEDSNNEEHIEQDVVVLDKEFNDKVPMYYIDSGIVITFAFINLLEDEGLSQRKIKQFIINGNPHNIDYRTADVLIDLYNKNKNGEVAFLVPPAVYKETMIDNLKHDNLNKQYTRKFVTENCFLAFPSEDIKSFARKSAALESKLKNIHSRDYIFGLNPEIKRRKVDDSGRKEKFDDNLEDRLILSEIAVMTKQGKQNIQYISFHSNIEETREMVQDLYDEEQQLDKLKTIRSPKEKKRGQESVIFIQINSKDFGTKVSIKGSNSTETKGKSQVARQLEQFFNRYFEGKGGMEIKTPLEL